MKLFLAGCGTAGLFIIAACTSSSLPGTADDTATSAQHDGGFAEVQDSAMPKDGGDAAMLPIDCTTATQNGDIVQAIGELGGLPAARGGTIPPGIYTLLALNEYGGANDADAGDDDVSERETDDYAQKTISLASNGVFHRIEASGHGGTVGAATVSGGTWTTTDAGLLLTNECTAGSTETIPYFFAGRNLYLFHDSPTAAQEQYVTP